MTVDRDRQVIQEGRRQKEEGFSYLGEKEEGKNNSVPPHIKLV
ncbi:MULTISPECIES: hypothetical protein [unclassified Okeania]|nr:MULTISPECIES: hypothetical protein [unclassified Okeania]